MASIKCTRQDVRGSSPGDGGVIQISLIREPACILARKRGRAFARKPTDAHKDVVMRMGKNKNSGDGRRPGHAGGPPLRCSSLPHCHLLPEPRGRRPRAWWVHNGPRGPSLAAPSLPARPRAPPAHGTAPLRLVTRSTAKGPICCSTIPKSDREFTKNMLAFMDNRRTSELAISSEAVGEIASFQY